MRRFPKTFQLCRQSHCAQGAGLSGFCPDHLRASLRRRPLGELLNLLETMLARPLASEDFEESPRAPLLN
jgi:hypothetical protein